MKQNQDKYHLGALGRAPRWCVCHSEPAAVVEADFVALNKAQRLLLIFRYWEESKEGKEHRPGLRPGVTHEIKRNRALGRNELWGKLNTLLALERGWNWGPSPRITKSSRSCKSRKHMQAGKTHRHHETGEEQMWLLLLHIHRWPGQKQPGTRWWACCSSCAGGENVSRPCKAFPSALSGPSSPGPGLPGWAL